MERTVERKVCPVCGRVFYDRHIWDTDSIYCNLLCADYATAQQTGKKPMATLEELLKWAEETPEYTHHKPS